MLPNERINLQAEIPNLHMAVDFIFEIIFLNPSFSFTTLENPVLAKAEWINANDIEDPGSQTGVMIF